MGEQRLIDADTLINEFDRKCATECPICIYSKGGFPCKLIDSAPVVERRRVGRWLEDSGNIACSECRKIWLYRRTDFCPNCGADMRSSGEAGLGYTAGGKGA